MQHCRMSLCQFFLDALVRLYQPAYRWRWISFRGVQALKVIKHLDVLKHDVRCLLDGSIAALHTDLAFQCTEEASAIALAALMLLMAMVRAYTGFARAAGRESRSLRMTPNIHFSADTLIPSKLQPKP